MPETSTLRGPVSSFGGSVMTYLTAALARRGRNDKRRYQGGIP